jgi:hypothetical protein
MRLRHAGASESGFAMAVAVLALFVLGMLAVAAVSVSVSASRSTTRDESQKSALEAAEAGLRAATYRLNMMGPEPEACLESKNAIQKPEAGYCVGPKESLGNKASFTYWMTTAGAGGTCAGEALSGSSQLLQRCITAEGVVNEGTPTAVKQRLQARVAAIQASTSLFTVAGIVGLEELKVTGSVDVKGIAASNGNIIAEGSGTFEKGYELGPSGTFKPAVGTERIKSGVKVNGPEVIEKENFVYSLPTNHATASSNEDSRISSKSDESYENTKNAIEYSGSPNYTLKMKSEPKLTLGGSQYYFCNVKLENASKLIIASGAKTEIFIDSSEDPTSKCPAESGKFEILGNSKVENLSKQATSLLIEIYGKGKFKLENGSKLEANILAPFSEVNMNGGTSFIGAIVGAKVHLENGSGIFEWSTEDGNFKAGNAGTPTYYRTAWQPCKPNSATTSC